MNFTTLVDVKEFATNVLVELAENPNSSNTKFVKMNDGCEPPDPVTVYVILPVDADVRVFGEEDA